MSSLGAGHSGEAFGDHLLTAWRRSRRCAGYPELGVNFIDTADSYGPDVSEQLIREALHPDEGLLIATKAGRTLAAGGTARGRSTSEGDAEIAEHWDVWQDEATQANSKSGLPMFGDRFPA